MEDTKLTSRERMSEALYDRCCEDARNSEEGCYRKTYNQDDLLALCDSPDLVHINDLKTLVPIVTELSNNMHFIILKNKTGTRWSLRPRHAATKVKALNVEERMVYTTIEEAHQSGIWIKTIKTKTNIKDQKHMDKIVARLEKLDLIKQIKDIKSPAKRTYMLKHLDASEDVTGGSFYDGGDLDESLVEELSNLIVFHVRQMSWVDERRKRIKRESSPIIIRDDAVQADAGAPERGRKKRKHDTTAAKDIEDSAPPKKQRTHKHINDPEPEPSRSQLAFPTGHEYPTATSIHDFITNNNIIRRSKAESLKITDIQEILDVMVWDGKLEVVNEGYRTVRGVEFKQPGEMDDPEEEAERKRGNGLTEAPCGRCPVIDLCGDGGPINAASCVYFERWSNPERDMVKQEVIVV